MTGEKVMVVDDNEDFLNEIQELLFLCGYDPKVVYDGAIAFKAACKIKPDVILLDLKMKGINGFQVAKELKQSVETAEIPIIAMSGYFPIENHSLLLDMNNMNGRIKKPFDISDLITEIETALDKTSNYKQNVEDKCYLKQ